jgi:hypothetical protein
MMQDGVILIAGVIYFCYEVSRVCDVRHILSCAITWLWRKYEQTTKI